jgi:hypothetical protein
LLIPFMGSILLFVHDVVVIVCRHIGHVNKYRVVDRSSEFVFGTGWPGLFELYLKIGKLVGVIPELQCAAQLDPDFDRGFARIG